MKVVFVNKKIGEVLQEESTWFTKYDEEYFKIQGKVFKRMTNKYYKFLIIQYAIRKYHLYKRDITLLKAFNSMIKGAS